MGFKDIMVHLDCSQQYLNRLELAVKLAKEHDAKLTGLYAIIHQQYKPDSEGLRHRIAEVEEMFRLKTTNENIEAQWLCVDWPVVGNNMVEMVNYYSHAKDLIIVGQVGHGSQEKDVPRDLPERVVLGSGRPTLVVPYVGSFGSTGSKIIVAWKSGRASARALNDAMPFLVSAQEVHLLEIRGPEEQSGLSISPQDDIVAHLERHGIKATMEHLVTGNIPIANILMNYAWENGCDMIVMGTYSSSSRGTINLGTVANQMLDMMTLPVLMAH